jgi:hypothetical protein
MEEGAGLGALVEEAREASHRAQEVRLEELHRRVKNNFQMVSSLPMDIPIAVGGYTAGSNQDAAAPLGDLLAAVRCPGAMRV